MPIKVAIVEDSQEVREGIAYLLKASQGFQCVATFGSAEDALDDLVKAEPDVVLMDIGLPGMSGIECIRQLKPSNPQIEFMVLSVFEDEERILESIKAGASGYLIKNTPPAKILEAIQDLHNGGSPMSNQIARRVLESMRGDSSGNSELDGLSKREQIVLQNLSEGFMYKEIAENLSISIHTVRSHVHNIYEKLHVSNRTEALRKVHQQGRLFSF